MSARFTLLSSIAALSLVTACGGGEPAPAPDPGPAVNYPEWVMKGSGAFGGDRGRAFYGVGAASGISNPALARTTADNRARNEIAKIFKTYSASLMKDYMSATTDGTGSEETQHIENAIKTFTAATLSGVQIVDHWIHPVDGTMYALAQLDIEAFTKAAEQVQELSDKAKAYIKDNAQKSFDSLEAEENKAAAE